MSVTPNAPDSPAAGNGWTPRAGHLVIALLLATGLFLFRLGQDAPLSPEECHIGQTAREMDGAGNWIIPRFSGETRLSKPPLAYWTAALSWRLVGQLNALALRLPSAVAGVACLVAIWSLARTMFGARTAFVTGVVFASAAGTLWYTHTATVHMPLALWCVLGVVGFEHGLRAKSGAARRAWLAMFYACLGIGMLAAMPMPLFVVLPGLLAYLFVTRRLNEVPRLFLLPGVLIFAAVFGWWIISLGRAPVVGFDTLALTWQQKLLPWYSGGLSAGTSDRPLFPLAVLAATLLPWAFCLPEALAAPYLKRYGEHRRSLWLPWCLLATNLLIFTLVRFKRAEYMVPSLPWAAMLAGVVLERLFFRAAERKPLEHRNLILLAAAVIMGFGIGARELVGHLGHPPWPFLWKTILLLWIGGAALLVAMWFFQAGYVRISFATVAASGVAVFVVARTVVVPLTAAEPNYLGFAEGLRQVVSIPAGDDLRWLCEPNPCLVFHTNQTCKPVLSELELARQQRQTRGTGTMPGPEQLLGEVVLRRLQGPEPFFAVGEAKWLEAWSDQPEYARVAHTIYRYPSFDGDPDNDLVVFTNDAGTSYVRREDKRPIRFSGGSETRAARERRSRTSSSGPSSR